MYVFQKLGEKNFVANKFRKGQMSRWKKFGGFSLICPEKFGRFFSGAHKEIYEKQKKWRPRRQRFLAGQISHPKNLVGFFKPVWKNLLGIPGNEICPPKFILGETFPLVLFKIRVIWLLLFFLA